MAEASHKQDVTVAVNDPLCGRVLNGRFSILEPIGSGGMGKVYKAIQAPLDRMVAIKVLHPQFSSNNRDPGFVKRFVLEASLTSKLRHPNTVTVIDYGQTEDGIFYIAMEYLEGQSLAEVLVKQGALPWQRALHIGQQVCRSLREAHRFGIIHRDLKPANVMLLDEADHDLVKVLDFGLVKSFVGDGSTPDAEPDSKITQAGMLLGSPQYMSPEQARNHADPRSDVYSFGVVLYETITGRPPFMAKDYLEVIVKHLKEPPAPLHTVRPDLSIPVEVEDLVFRCLEKDPAHRFQSMDEVLEALRGLGAGGMHNSFPGDSRQGSGALPGLPAGVAGVTPAPVAAARIRDLTPRPEAEPNYTPPPAQPGTPPPYARVPGTNPSLKRTRPGTQPGVPPPVPTPVSTRPGLPPMVPTPVSTRQVPAPPLSEEPETHRSGPAPMMGREPGTNVFAVSQEPAGGNRMVMLAAAGVGVALVLGLGIFVLTRPSAPPAQPGATATAAATPAAAAPAQPAAAPAPAPVAPAPAAAAGTGTGVKFRVISEPPGAQVFMGSRGMLGETPVEFEVPSDKPDGTVTVDMVLILDGYYPLPVTAGGSGVVIITQRMQKRAGAAAGAGPGKAPGAATRKGPGGKRVEEELDERLDAPELMVEAPLIAAPPPKAPEPAPPLEPAPVAAAPTPPPPAPAGVVQFNGETMNRPVVVDKGKPLQYTPEAARARVEGLMIVKCVIGTTGKVENCRVLKTLPYMEKAVLEALTSRTYRPVTQDGRVVPVDYVFEVKLNLPREPL